MENSTAGPKISVAPMMGWTDRHCRYFLRQLSSSVQLYTEMITAQAIQFGDADSLLRHDAAEQPLAAQLGGSDPRLMAAAAARAAVAGYEEININVGCPSDRVQSGQFGACLMAQPKIVAACFSAMRDAVGVPVSVKTRVGIDANDSYEFVDEFISILARAGCRKFIVHARVAVLDGLSPKQNRAIPPLNYERVFRLKEQHPDLEVVLNGGITGIGQVEAILDKVDGIMIGREAYQRPYFLAELERHFDPDRPLPDRREIVADMIPYIEAQLAQGDRLGSIARHMLGLFTGQPGARSWRRYISEHAYRDGAGAEVLLDALEAMPIAARSARYAGVARKTG